MNSRACGLPDDVASSRVETPATGHQLSDFARRASGQFDRLPVKYARQRASPPIRPARVDRP
ncbi:hypothetical protein E2C01_064340 [Portunus trituberculatus]|uniref:Uncharacterized protein n=1 Tax=Portunus trituberculatus TaxID=210409 RepID=A0A5B7HFY3_PORTR|nr:hypothetical protein [Portunus trituberculatus]